MNICICFAAPIFSTATEYAGEMGMQQRGAQRAGSDTEGHSPQVISLTTFLYHKEEKIVID